MSSNKINEIIKEYEMKKSCLYNCTYGEDTRPLIMNYIVFMCLRDYAIELLPQFRKVILCFEHFTYESITGAAEVKGRNKGPKRPPKHCIVLQVKFLDGIKLNKYQNIGTIGYFDFTDREIVAEGIKEYIEDLHRCDLHVIATCSSGKCEILAILYEMRMKSENDMLTYPVKYRPSVIHVFDSSWMLRKLKREFLISDVTFSVYGQPYCASYDYIQMLIEIKNLKALFKSDVYNTANRTTASAAKLFSNTVGVLLGRLHELNKQVYTKMEGTKIFALFFDQLFDTFNAARTIPSGNNKRYRCPLTMNSDHWEMWRDMMLTLKTMKFVPKTSVAKTVQFTIMDDNKINKKQNKSDTVQITNVPEKNCKNNKKGKGGKKKNKQVNKSVETVQNTRPEAVSKNEQTNKRFSDNEYQSATYEENGHDAFLEIISNIMEPNAENLKTPLNDLEHNALKRNILKKVSNQKYFSTSDNVIESINAILKPFEKTTHQKHFRQIGCLLKAIKISNDGMNTKFVGSLTYDYLTFKYCDVILRTAEKASDTREFYNEFIDALTSTLKMLHYFDMSLFQMWSSSIAGLKGIFTYLYDHHYDEFDTKIVNCDSVHNFVSLIREHNGLDAMYIVDAAVYGDMFDYHVCVLAFTEDCNQTITSLLITKEDVRKLTIDKTD